MIKGFIEIVVSLNITFISVVAVVHDKVLNSHKDFILVKLFIGSWVFQSKIIHKGSQE